MAQFGGGRWAYRAEKARQSGQSSRQERKLLYGIGQSILDMGTTLGVEYAKWKLGGEEAAEAALKTAGAAETTALGSRAKNLGLAKESLAKAAQTEAATSIGERMFADASGLGDIPRGSKATMGGLAVGRAHKPVPKSVSSTKTRKDPVISNAEKRLTSMTAMRDITTNRLKEIEARGLDATPEEVAEYRQLSPLLARQNRAIIELTTNMAGVRGVSPDAFPYRPAVGSPKERDIAKFTGKEFGRGEMSVRLVDDSIEAIEDNKDAIVLAMFERAVATGQIKDTSEAGRERGFTVLKRALDTAIETVKGTRVDPATGKKAILEPAAREQLTWELLRDIAASPAGGQDIIRHISAKVRHNMNAEVLAVWDRLLLGLGR